MEAVKIHMLATILATQLVAIYDGSVPYFPIEISRTAASSPTATHVLGAGILSMLPLLYRTNTLNVMTYGMWLGLAIVAIVPDTVSKSGHMAGVAVLYIAALARIFTELNAAAFMHFLCSLFIFGIRLFFKVGILLLYDTPTRQSWRTPTDIFFNPRVGQTIYNRSMEIMFGGPSAFKYVEDASVILPIFKVCGVLQWVSFYMLSFVF